MYALALVANEGVLLLHARCRGMQLAKLVVVCAGMQLPAMCHTGTRMDDVW